MNIGRILLITALLILVGCGQKNVSKKTIGGGDRATSISVQNDSKVDEKTAAFKEFSVPEIPSYLQGQEAQMDFIVDHFWDRMDFTDTVMLSQNVRAIAEYVSFLHQVPLEKSHPALLHLLEKTENHPAVTAFMLDKLKIFLMDPNSPIRNDEIYEAVCHYIIEKSDDLDPEKFQAELELKFIQKNRRGTVAHDFVAQDLDGKKVRLHQIMSPYTFVIFYNPDCHGCDESMAYIKASPVLNSDPVKALMKIVAVYIDQSPEIWEHAKEMIPKNWISLWDRQGKLRQDEIYDLNAIPTLYLLDDQKRVLLKDANLPDVENYFVRLLNGE